MELHDQATATAESVVVIVRGVLSTVGATGDRLSLARDALLGLGRITQFVATLDQEWLAAEFKPRLGAVSKDIGSLNEYEGQLSNKVQFLLDAVLGFITIEQNDLFKVLTVVSVVGIPPTDRVKLSEQKRLELEARIDRSNTENL